MSDQVAFDYPPDFGNAVALVVYYAVFLIAQVALGVWYIRRWNWPIFLGLVMFLNVVILGSVAYLKLHYAPVADAWYSLWIFTLTAGSAFFIASIHLCMGLVLQDSRSKSFEHGFLQLSSMAYITTCLAIDALSLLLSIIGGAYAGVKSSVSSKAADPGFNLMVAAMAIQLCGLAIMLITGIRVVVSFRNHECKDVPQTGSMDKAAEISADKTTLPVKTVKRPMTFLTSLISVGVLLFTQTVVRAVDIAGGFDGPLRIPVLPNVEAILLFVGILMITAFHPAVQLQKPAYDTTGK